jgi:2-polyprenyl-3-methyl-5-hydroxy-6-metoxy-1,4-benzoquinol methylase
MSTTAPAPTVLEQESDIGAQIEAFAGRILEAFLGSADILSVFIGEQLGLYRALGDDGPATSSELAARSGLDERYVREWLEQQAVTGILQAENAAAAAQDRLFGLPPAQAEVLLNADGLAYLTPVTRMLVGVIPQVPHLLDAFRTGGGVPWSQYGAAMREAQAELNRPLFLNMLGSDLFPAIPEIHSRLSRPGAKIADIGCGGGWSAIAIALAYPGARVLGVDDDEASIELARRNAAEASVSDRVSFELRDAATLDTTDTFDVVAAFEVIHDLAQPVETLRAMRTLAGVNGQVLIMDEKVAETFTAPGDPIERLMYAASVFVCLPTGRATDPSAATGTVMRPETLRHYATEAGYTQVEVLPLEAGFFRFYLLHG